MYVVCAKEGKRKESRCSCKNCETHPGLRPVPCFEKFHIENKHFQKFDVNNIYIRILLV